jgi:hypothetical protein
MARVATLGAALLLVVALVTPADVLAQSKDDTIVYALQSDVQNWDPPNSVLRESIIFGYNVFDHLAARDLKTGKVGPSWRPRGRPSTTPPGSQAPQRREVPRRHAVRRQGRQGQLRPGTEPREQAPTRSSHAKIKSVEIVDDLPCAKTDGPTVFVERSRRS